MPNLHSNRRRILAGIGGGAAFALGGGALWRAREGQPSAADEAYAPWRRWDDPALRGTSMALVAAGLLAANPHDTQPWRFRVSDAAIEVYADLSRNLGAMDANLREMHLGLGCAIENMLQVAAPNGFSATLQAEPGSLAELSAREGLSKAATLRLSRREPAAPDPLARAIPYRHTNRFPYDHAREAPPQWRAFAQSAGVDEGVRVFLFDEGEARRAFDAAVLDATSAITADLQMIADSDRWLRATRGEIAEHRDGPTLETAGLSTTTYWLAKSFPVSADTAHRAWLEQTRKVQLATAPLVGLIATADRYDRPSAIAAGRTWQRLHLSATAQRIAMQPLNQPIEMIDRERQTGRGDAWNRRIAELTGAGWQATFAFRAGLPTQDAPPSPRRALADVILI